MSCTTKAQQNADAQQTLGVKVELAGNTAQNAVGKINSNSGALDSNASSALGAANAQNNISRACDKQQFKQQLQIN